MLIKTTTDRDECSDSFNGETDLGLPTHLSLHSFPSSHFSPAGERTSAGEPEPVQVRSKLQWIAISGCRSRGRSITTMILWRRVLPQAAHNHRCHPACCSPASTDRCTSGLCPEEIDERWVAKSCSFISASEIRLVVLTIVCWWAQAAIGRRTAPRRLFCRSFMHCCWRGRQRGQFNSW